MDIHITIPRARLVELETAEYERKVLEDALLQAQSAAIQLAHRDTQRRAEYEDLKRTMHNMTRNHRIQLDAAVAAERAQIRSRLLTMNDAAKGRHNHYAHAALVLFGA